MKSARSLALAVQFVVLVTACGVSEAPLQPTPTVSALPGVPTSTPTASVPPTASLPPTQSPSITERPTSTVAPTPDNRDFVLLEEHSIGGYAIRLWQPVPGTGMYQHATLSTAGQPEIRIEAVSAIGSLPEEDVTGDGFPDVWFETKMGGSRCCWGTIVYSLGLTPAKVLDISSLPDYYGTGTGTFQDLDGDDRYEFITRDPLIGSPCTAPTVKVILQYVPGQGYVGAGPHFAEAYADDIAIHTRRAEEHVELSRDAYKCGVYELIADYLYSGQSDRAWQELRRLYLGPDLEQFQSQLEASARQGRFFVPAATSSSLMWKHPT